MFTYPIAGWFTYRYELINSWALVVLCKVWWMFMLTLITLHISWNIARTGANDVPHYLTMSCLGVKYARVNRHWGLHTNSVSVVSITRPRDALHRKMNSYKWPYSILIVSEMFTKSRYNYVCLKVVCRRKCCNEFKVYI